MKKKTIGILATSVAVGALCVMTDAPAIAGHGGGGGGHGGGGGGGFHGGGGGGGFHGGGGGFAAFHGGGVAGMAEVAGFTDLLPMLGRPISVMGGVVMH